MSEIGMDVLFKNEAGESISIFDEYVKLHSKSKSDLIVNFYAPQDQIVKLKDFFLKFSNNQIIKLNIGGTGDIECLFKGISPIMEDSTKGQTYYSLSLTLEDIDKKKSSKAEMDGVSDCGGCFDNK